MGPSANRRRCTRVPIAFRVKVLSELGTIASSAAVNVSLSGILIRAVQPLPLGTPCHVVLFLLAEGEEDKVLAQGVVVREEPESLAIRFTKLLGDESRTNLQRLLQGHSPDPEALKEEFEAFVLAGRTA